MWKGQNRAKPIIPKANISRIRHETGAGKATGFFQQKFKNRNKLQQTSEALNGTRGLSL
jgi:hypothetical protein